MRVRLSVAAPLRVGGREQQVNKLEFVRHQRKVHAVSLRKLGRLLLSRSERTLNDWSVEVLTKGQNADLTSFLRGQNLLNDGSIGEISRYFIPDVAGVENQFLPHARDARGQLFIPGTAVKGAIRAAIMWALVDDDRVNRYVQSNESSKARFYANHLDRKALQSYELPSRKLRIGPHHDLMRAVKVADAYGDLQSRMERILIQSYTEHGGVRTASLGASDTIYVECLMPGSGAEFDLKVDQKILDDFQAQNSELPFTDEESLLRLVQDFYSAVWQFERRYYGIGAEQESEPESSRHDKEEFPSQEEWITQKYGQMSKTQQRRYRGEYRLAREEFENSHTENARGDSPTAVIDGREMPLRKIRDFYSGAAPGFRLGWGSGLMSTTVDLRLDEENVGKVLNLISRKHHPHATPREGPKSRKLVGEGREPRWPMGWGSLEIM